MTPDPILLQQSAQCQHCHIWFRWTSIRQSFCSNGCKVRFAQKRMRRNHGDKLKHETSLHLTSQGTVGTIAELAVCMDLMRRGYHVFRAMAADSFCDLMARKAIKVLQIEVRTGLLQGTHLKVNRKTRYGVNCLAIYERETDAIMYFRPRTRELMVV